MVLENDNKPSEPSPDRFKAKKAPPRQGELSQLFLLFSPSLVLSFLYLTVLLVFDGDELEQSTF